MRSFASCKVKNVLTLWNMPGSQVLLQPQQTLISRDLQVGPSPDRQPDGGSTRAIRETQACSRRGKFVCTWLDKRLDKHALWSM